MIVFSIIFFVYAILMYLYIHTFYYLKKVETCKCFNKTDVNIPFMEFFQLLEIIGMTITMLIIFDGNLKIPKLYTQSKNKNRTIVILFVFFINLYMAYNVYYFFMSLRAGCKCTNTWNVWWLFTEGLITTVSCIRVILALAIVGYALTFHKFKFHIKRMK